MILEAAFVIGVGLMPTGISTIDDAMTRDALNHASLASYKQLGLDNTMSRIERRYLDDDLRNAGAICAWTYAMVKDKRIIYGWTF